MTCANPLHFVILYFLTSLLGQAFAILAPQESELTSLACCEKSQWWPSIWFATLTQTNLRDLLLPRGDELGEPRCRGAHSRTPRSATSKMELALLASWGKLYWLFPAATGWAKVTKCPEGSWYPTSRIP